MEVAKTILYSDAATHRYVHRTMDTIKQTRESRNTRPPIWRPDFTQRHSGNFMRISGNTFNY